MKTTLLLLLPVLLSLATKPVSGAAENAHKEPVRDVHGDELRVGTPYYIVSAIWGAGGGGVSLDAPRNSTCPLYLVQLGRDVQMGMRMYFVPKDRSEGVIYQSTDYQIIFSDIPTFMWNLGEPNEVPGKRFITTSRVERNLGATTPSSWFRIESLGSFAYKLVSCPTATGCEDVGRYFDDGLRRLALGDGVGTFPVLFVKKDPLAVRLSKQ